MCVPSCFSHVWLLAVPWTVACQAPQFMGFSRQEYWSGFPCPSPGDLSDPGIEPLSLASPALAGGFFTTSTTCGEGNGTPFQYSCLENPVDGGAWRAAVHGVTEGRTWLSNFTFTFHFHALEKEMATTPMFLPGESQGRRSLVGCRLWGCTESDTTEVT